MHEYLKVISFDPLADPYFVGERGGSCEDGSMIMDRNECKNACDMLEMITGTLKNNKACYRAGNGKCRQDGRFNGPNTKISLICKSIINGTIYFKNLYHPLGKKSTIKTI